MDMKRLKIMLAVLGLFLLPSATGAAEPPVFRVTKTEVEQAVRDALSAKGIGDNIMVSLFGSEGDVAVASYPLKMEVDELEADPVSGRWNATLYFFSENRNLPPRKVYGRYEEIIEVPVLTRKFAAGEVITGEDIGMQQLPSSRVRKTMILDVAQIVGKTPRKIISPDRPIRENELSSPVVISKGAAVQMNYRSGNMQIQALGEALEEGGIGDVIRLRNTDSRSVVRGKITAPGRVSVFGNDGNEKDTAP